MCGHVWRNPNRPLEHAEGEQHHTNARKISAQIGSWNGVEPHSKKGADRQTNGKCAAGVEVIHIAKHELIDRATHRARMEPRGAKKFWRGKNSLEKQGSG